MSNVAKAQDRTHIVVGLKEKIELEALKDLLGKSLAKKYGARRASIEVVIRFLLDEFYRQHPQIRDFVESIVRTRQTLENLKERIDVEILEKEIT